MNEFFEFICDAVRSVAHRLVISGAKQGSEYRKITLTLLAGEYYIERFTDTQAFHSHITACAASDGELCRVANEIASLTVGFSQINAWNEEYEFTARLTKKGKLLTGKHRCASAPTKEDAQDRAKNYLLDGRRVVPPLVDMGVMTPAGEIKKDMYDKFRQINRFLEFIDEIIRNDSLEKLNIIDFGCGKSYLTFIVYYYFTQLKHIPVRMTGIDLKTDVISFCTGLAEKYGYDGLKFINGDIADFDNGEAVDMVISLHACDTATDFALYNAVKRNARYILSVPCCQHELAGSASFASMPLFDDNGILRERISALMTDSLRKELLTACGYKARVMEFVDLTHTPKNLLIRAKRASIPDIQKKRALQTVEETLSVLGTEQTLHRLLKEAGIL